MIARYTSAIVTGSATTFFVFFMMQALIAWQPGAASEPRERWNLTFVRVPEPEEIRTNDLQPIDKRIREFSDPPPRPPGDPGQLTGVGFKAPPPLDPPARDGGIRFDMSDGPLVAIVRVAPIYPAIAEARGIEGWVLVEFEVQPDGSVANAFVVESSSRLFENSALAAVYKFRFKPRVVDGVPQRASGLQNLFRYEISED